MLNFRCDRRKALTLGAVTLATLALPISKSSSAYALEDTSAGFKLPPLPYGYDALEPIIGKETMQIHHDKHHQAYVNNLNSALKEYPQYFSWSIEKLVASTSKLPKGIQKAVTNQGGGHLNHTMFWKSMAPVSIAEKTSPSGQLLKAIDQRFGSLDNFKKEFEKAGSGIFGSGWVWLVKNPKDSKLQIITTANQDSPFALADTVPILGNDVWEHAYYLNYQNRRADYLKAWWQVVNWDEISKRFL